MPCEILVVAVEKPGTTKRGFPWTVKDSPAEWGTKEGLPNWVKVRITDATKAQVEHYLGEWHKDFVYSIVSEGVFGYRVKVEVDPELISLSGVNKSLSFGLGNYLRNTWKATLISYSDTEAVIDILKPVDLQKVKAGMSDLFKSRVSTRRYYFSSADVDTAVASGGLVELTRTQVLSRIKDGLLD